MEVFSDDSATEKGWVSNSTATTGAWERAMPIPTGGAPSTDDPDGAGDGYCFVTDNGLVGGFDGVNDIDDGIVVLASQTMDFSAGDGLISWTRWFFNSNADLEDELLIEITNDSGQTWTTVAEIEEHTGGWIRETIRVSDYVSPTSTVRLRFQVDDDPSDSVTEAALDSVVAEVFDSSVDAVVTFRNGTGSNPAVFSSVTLPLLGTNWDTLVDGTATGASGGNTFVFIYEDGLTGFPTVLGELLLDVTSPQIAFSIAPVLTGPSMHSASIPADPTLLGLSFAIQGYVSETRQLTNALDVILGNQ